MYMMCHDDYIKKLFILEFKKLSLSNFLVLKVAITVTWWWFNHKM